MPSKLFQKRKAEAERRALRLKADRVDRIRILVVAEGSKTEPNYLTEFASRAGGGRVELFVTRDRNTAPTTLLRQARDILESDGDFDRAFIVCDRDEFDDFVRIRNASEQIASTPNIEFIYSDPCFEYWIVLHFEYFDAPISRRDAIRRVKKHIPDYEKGMHALASKLIPKTDVAISNSRRALKRCERTGGTCPSTLLHIVVEALRAN